jgi:DNA-directed RNA polymerase subunit RPC12/RpoP
MNQFKICSACKKEFDKGGFYLQNNSIVCADCGIEVVKTEKNTIVKDNQDKKSYIPPKNKFGGRQEGAGRPKGSKNKATIEKEKAEELFKQRILENLEPIFKAQLKIATGKNPNIKAIDSFIERLFGKAVQRTDLTKGGARTITEIMREAKEEANQAADE